MTEHLDTAWLDFAILLTQFTVPVLVVTPLLVAWCERVQAADRRAWWAPPKFRQSDAPPQA